MSSINFEFNNCSLNIFIGHVKLFGFTDDKEENKRVLNNELDYLIKKIITDSSFSATKVEPPIWLPLLCHQLDKTVPLKKDNWEERFNQMLNNVRKETVTTKDYIFLDLK